MLTITSIVTLYILLHFQARRRKNLTHSTARYPIRNILFEWENNRHPTPHVDPPRTFNYSKSLLSYIDLRTSYVISTNYQNMLDAQRERFYVIEEPFDLYKIVPYDDLPEDRLPAPGITFSGRIYHSIPSGTLRIQEKEVVISHDPSFVETPEFRTNILFSEKSDLTGSPPHPRIAQIISDWFPHYYRYLDEYCRPPSFGPQAFHDFNRPTEHHPPPSTDRHSAIMRIVRSKMNIRPYRPQHFADALSAETPLSTSASYFSKFDPATRIFSRYSAPSRYANRPQSKGYNINSMLNAFRTELHHVKYERFPFPTDFHDPEELPNILQNWFARHPAQLFIRTQISKRDPTLPKKIRPVYSVDDRFLHTEKMLFTPALAQMRNPECCVAHGLETFRGSMSLIDKIALFFSSFISLDWSQYDQRLPYYVIVAFFLDYLPSLLIVSHGYMPTVYYPDTTEDIHTFADKIFNVMIFLISWYFSTTFLSFDGFAFIRSNGGVPSGLLNTQFLDSFGNMYVIVDCLLEFGFTEEECHQMLFCVLGDDNLIFMKQNFDRVCAFMTFLVSYSETRHGMVLSILKSMYSTLRHKITFLSYENNYGMPSRPIGKLVAQLAYPERPISSRDEWIHAARALGLAYASCGQDPTFHLLCKMVYDAFRPRDPIPSDKIQKIFSKWQHQLPDFDLDSDVYSFPTFPTSEYIKSLVKSYHGAFSEVDKWNFDLFTVPPSDNLSNYVTLSDYIQSSEEKSRLVNEFWHGTRSLNIVQTHPYSCVLDNCKDSGLWI
nr:RNA-dependent RNA polymerase [Sarcosphaera coronaria partitivirus]